MKASLKFASSYIFCCLLILFAGTAFAQDDANAPDPPSRVARLSYLSGDVSFQPNGVDDWTSANLNRPLTTSDRLWTGRGARAELQIGNATMRLDGETSFTLANLDDRRAQIQIAEGVLNVHLRQIEADESFEIDTPNFTVNLLRAGDYTVKVDNDNNVSWITVRTGTAEATGGAQAVTIQPGQQARFSGTSGGTYDVAAAPGPDSFDQWCSARDRRAESARSAEYVSRSVIGYEDLDEYGSWQTYADYGPVWVPLVRAGWAPYHYGHWAWIYPWGWTWVDDAPWGFAPFHYGRWIHAGFGWGWVPGPVYVRPVYAPALVAWCGGSGWGVGLGFGSGVGWFPLGPREPFIPWYWGSQRYFSRVNYTNTRITNINITNYYNNYYRPRWHDRDGRPGHDDWRSGGHRDDRDIRTIAHIDYANRHAPNGMTFVDHDSFVNGRPVFKSTLKIPPDKLRDAPVVTDIGSRPGHLSLLGGHADTPKFRPPQNAFNRPVISRDVAPKPLPFATQTKTFVNPHPRTEMQTRTFGDAGRPKPGNGVSNPQGTVMPPPKSQGSDAFVGNKHVVPRPPDRNIGDHRTANDSIRDTGHIVPANPGHVQVDFGPKGPSDKPVETQVNRPHWNVPKPADDARRNVDTSVRENNNITPRTWEQQGKPVVQQPVHEQVNVNQGHPNTTVREYHPPQPERVQRNVDPPARPVIVRETPPARTNVEPQHNSGWSGGGHPSGGNQAGGHPSSGSQSSGHASSGGGQGGGHSGGGNQGGGGHSGGQSSSQGQGGRRSN